MVVPPSSYGTQTKSCKVWAARALASDLAAPENPCKLWATSRKTVETVVSSWVASGSAAMRALGPPARSALVVASLGGAPGVR
eukprot:4900228-Pyramimonas_sp.AAC.1